MKHLKIVTLTLFIGTVVFVGFPCTYSIGQRSSTPRQSTESNNLNASSALLEETKSEKEDISRIKQFLLKGADVNVRDIVAGIQYYTPLQYATKKHHWQTVKILVKRGAEVNPVIPFGDEHYFTPLMHCAAAGSPDIILLLIKHGAKVNAKGYHDLTALMLAVKNERTKNIKVLLIHKADVNAKTYFSKKSALDFARETNPKIARLLYQFATK